MKLTWLPRAREDVRQAYAYIAESSPKGAKAVVDRIDAQVDTLLEFPRIGRPGRVAGTRELVIQRTPYVVAYRLSGADIEILAVLHGARQWPERF